MSCKNISTSASFSAAAYKCILYANTKAQCVIIDGFQGYFLQLSLKNGISQLFVENIPQAVRVCSVLFKFHNKTFSRGSGGKIASNELLIVVGRGYCSLTPSSRVKYVQCFIRHIFSDTERSNVNTTHTVTG